MNSEIKQALNRLQNYIETENYSGFDPYDGLKSPLFRLPFFRSNKQIRFAFQQFIKRSPVNLRPFFGIKKGKNPVTLGLCIQAYAYLILIYPEKKETYLLQIKKLIAELEACSAKGFSGMCWGYDFDWEARYASIPAYQPTVVATGIISNALFECWKITGIQRCSDLVLETSKFVLQDLKRTNEGETFCFSYSPFDQQIVLNASMKGVRILAQAYFISKDKSLAEPALKALKFVLNKQQPDGSFAYSDKREKIDNYHTGYVLDCLDEYRNCFETEESGNELGLGLEFYTRNFFTAEGIPKFYNKEIYPVDCTAAGQSLLTLSRFGRTETAQKTADWMCRNMQDENGFFYFRKYRNRKLKTSFMRWSNAWMFVGLTYLLMKQRQKI